MNSITHGKRATVVFYMCMLGYGIVITFLYYQQITHHSLYVQVGREQYRRRVIIPAARGIITDRNDTPLASNVHAVSAFIAPYQLKNSVPVYDFLKEQFPHAYHSLCAHPHKKFMYVQRRLTRDQEQRIKDAHLPDIHFLEEATRYYASPACASIIGFVDTNNQGVYGVEKQCNSELTGSPELLILEKDARTKQFYYKKEVQKNAIPGKKITLAIDATLQFLVREQVHNTMTHFQACEGAAVIVNPANGEILALVSLDNQTSSPESFAHQLHKAVACTYELGSVMKIFVALAALEEGCTTKDEHIDCHNSKTAVVHGRTINTTAAHSILSFQDVIARSNNIGLAYIAHRLGPKLYDHYVRCGFGTQTGIELPGEQRGHITPPDCWSKQSIFSLSYGYEITATLIQLARALCIIARNGSPIELSLLKKHDAPPYIPPLYSATAINDIREILKATAQRGTARLSNFKDCTVMCKTGTANILEHGVYNPQKNIYTCAGIVEKGTYQRIIVVFIKEAARPNLYASQVAAPLFKQVAERMLIHEYPTIKDYV